MIMRRLAPLLLSAAVVACGADKPSSGPAPTASATASVAMPGPSAAPVETAKAPPAAKGPAVTLLGVQLDPAVATACKTDEPKRYFEYDSATLKGPDVEGLNALATCLTKGPLKGKTVELVGHVKDVDDAEFLKKAGASRAQAVANYLEAQNVTKSKLKPIAQGNDKPGAVPGVTSKSPKGEPPLAPERRVDVRLSK